jgi:hypothetical protein
VFPTNSSQNVQIRGSKGTAFEKDSSFILLSDESSKDDTDHGGSGSHSKLRYRSRPEVTESLLSRGSGSYLKVSSPPGASSSKFSTSTCLPERSHKSFDRRAQRSASLCQPVCRPTKSTQREKDDSTASLATSESHTYTSSVRGRRSKKPPPAPVFTGLAASIPSVLSPSNDNHSTRTAKDGRHSATISDSCSKSSVSFNLYENSSQSERAAQAKSDSITSLGSKSVRFKNSVHVRHSHTDGTGSDQGEGETFVKPQDETRPSRIGSFIPSPLMTGSGRPLSASERDHQSHTTSVRKTSHPNKPCEERAQSFCACPYHSVYHSSSNEPPTEPLNQDSGCENVDWTNYDGIGGVKNSAFGNAEHFDRPFDRYGKWAKEFQQVRDDMSTPLGGQPCCPSSSPGPKPFSRRSIFSSFFADSQHDQQSNASNFPNATRSAPATPTNEDFFRSARSP